MEITASMVKELREKTGAGMMDCKAALSENSGDFEAAVDWLRKKGIAKAAKKAGRVAAEGMVYAIGEGTKGAVVEVNSETDFVAKNDKFVEFVNTLAGIVLQSGETDVAKLASMPWPGGTNGSSTVEGKLKELIATIGENMSLRRAAWLEVPAGCVKPYIHMGGKIGVLVGISTTATGDKVEEVAKQVAMHVAAANPQALDRNSVDSSALGREKAIFEEQARASGKPDNIVEKIVEGRVNKYYEEICLVDQAFVMDPDQKVGAVVASLGDDAKISGYVRYALGEGIEKKSDDFAAEVAAAVSV